MLEFQVYISLEVKPPLENGNNYKQAMAQVVSWPTLPRVGEYVGLGPQYFHPSKLNRKVVSVAHNCLGGGLVAVILEPLSVSEGEVEELEKCGWRKVKSDA